MRCTMVTIMSVALIAGACASGDSAGRDGGTTVEAVPTRTSPGLRVLKVKVTAAPGLSAPVGENAVDRILAAASAALSRPTDQTSYPCPIVLERDGPVLTLPDEFHSTV